MLTVLGLVACCLTTMLPPSPCSNTPIHSLAAAAIMLLDRPSSKLHVQLPPFTRELLDRRRQ